MVMRSIHWIRAGVIFRTFRSPYHADGSTRSDQSDHRAQRERPASLPKLERCPALLLWRMDWKLPRSGFNWECVGTLHCPALPPIIRPDSDAPDSRHPPRPVRNRCPDRRGRDGGAHPFCGRQTSRMMGAVGEPGSRNRSSVNFREPSNVGYRPNIPLAYRDNPQRQDREAERVWEAGHDSASGTSDHYGVRGAYDTARRRHVVDAGLGLASDDLPARARPRGRRSRLQLGRQRTSRDRPRCPTGDLAAARAEVAGASGAKGASACSNADMTPALSLPWPRRHGAMGRTRGHRRQSHQHRHLREGPGGRIIEQQEREKTWVRHRLAPRRGPFSQGHFLTGK